MTQITQVDLQPNFTPRAIRALEVLTYTRATQNRYRLVTRDGTTIRNIGAATFHELRHLLRLHMSTSVSSYYRLAESRSQRGP